MGSTVTKHVEKQEKHSRGSCDKVYHEVDHLLRQELLPLVAVPRPREELDEVFCFDVLEIEEKI